MSKNVVTVQTHELIAGTIYAPSTISSCASRQDFKVVKNTHTHLTPGSVCGVAHTIAIIIYVVQ